MLKVKLSNKTPNDFIVYKSIIDTYLLYILKNKLTGVNTPRDKNKIIEQFVAAVLLFYDEETVKLIDLCYFVSSCKHTETFLQRIDTFNYSFTFASSLFSRENYLEDIIIYFFKDPENSEYYNNCKLCFKYLLNAIAVEFKGLILQVKRFLNSM